MPFPYSEKVLEYFKHPRNVGRIKDADAMAREGSPSCGDMVSLYLKVDEKTRRITDIKFESYGCASNIASGSVITEMAKGKTIEEAKKITWEDAVKELGGLPAVKVHCSVLAVDVLKAAIEDYEERHGLLKEKKPTTEEVVFKKMKSVVNPIVGLDIVVTKLVREVEVNKGMVRVRVALDEDHTFSEGIEEEIRGRLEHLWDVKSVEVLFEGE